MNFFMSFQERAQLGMEELSKQLPVTLKMARVQAAWLRTQSCSAQQKKRP